MSGVLRIGIAGPPGAGKTESANYLVNEHGFSEFAGSDFLKLEAVKLGCTLRERADYEIFQRKLRLERGASFIADLMIDMPGKRTAMVGLRNRFDIDKFKEAKGVIVAVVRPLELRFNSTYGTDPKYPNTIDEFKAVELAEYDDPDPYGIHAKYAMDNATHTIMNSDSLESLHKAWDEIVTVHSN